MTTRETIPVSAANPFPSENTSHSVMCAGQLSVCLFRGGGQRPCLFPSLFNSCHLTQIIA